MEGRRDVNKISNTKFQNTLVGFKLFSVLTLLIFSQSAINGQQKADNTYIEAATLWQQASGESSAIEYKTSVMERQLLDSDLRNTRLRTRRENAVIEVEAI